MKLFGNYRGWSVENLLPHLEDYPLRLRWGGAKVADAINGQVQLLNGVEQLQAFQGHCVSTVDWTTSLQWAEFWVSDGHLVLGRNFHHTQGKDIVVPTDRRWAEKNFWSLYKPSIGEWRIHVLKGKAIAHSKKFYHPSTPEPTTAPIVRARRLGYHMEHHTLPPVALKRLGVAAAAACGYELGAVDILEHGPGQWSVLEINSCPAIKDNYTITRYVEALKTL